MFLEANLMSGAFVSAIFSIPGFIASYISIDLMHTGDLGVLQYLLGNVLWELFIVLGGTKANSLKALGELMVMIRMASRHLNMRCPVGYLTLPMIKAEGAAKSPKLKLNASEMRHMLKVVHFMLAHLFNRDTTHEQLRFDCVNSLHKMYTELEGRSWGPEVAARVASLGRGHVILYAELAREFLDARGHLESGWVLWRMFPKHHLFLHVVEDELALVGNPRECWTYGDERAIGAAVDLAERSHPNTLHRFVVARYRL